jgi:hypothetical protein
MVEVDIQTISIAVASVSVALVAIYYVWEIRHQSKMRQTDVLWRIYSNFTSKEFVEAAMKIRSLEFEDYKDFVKKYGQFFSESSVSIALAIVANLYEGVGHLLHRQLISAELVYEFLPVNTMWEKIKPIVEGTRQQYNMPDMAAWFEYLYNEMEKREQKLQSKA